MVMPRTVVVVFIWIFTVVLLFVMLNTILIGLIYPTLNDIGGNLTFVNQTRFQEVKTLNTNAFYIIFAIMGSIPFIFLVMKLLFSREPAPTEGGFANAIRV